MIEKNKYTFFVHSKLTKIQIKSIIQRLYNVQIISIQTCRPTKRKKRFNKFEGYKIKYKKAIIRIQPNQLIQILPKD